MKNSGQVPTPFRDGAMLVLECIGAVSAFNVGLLFAPIVLSVAAFFTLVEILIEASN